MKKLLYIITGYECPFCHESAKTIEELDKLHRLGCYYAKSAQQTAVDNSDLVIYDNVVFEEEYPPKRMQIPPEKR